MTTPYDRSKIFSEERLELIRKNISEIDSSDNVILTCGSYARREASTNSDIDFFVINKSASTYESNKLKTINDKIAEIVPIEPSAEGAFAKVEEYKTLISNIGGDQDTNQKMTRRMLFLLEGEWLFNENGLREFRRAVLEKYIGPKITDHQLALFLLNDIIRYYRTIATDYEFKITEGGKPWGIRNIKLVFSRKLLYASGLFSVALTADQTRDRKISVLEELFNIPVIDRMVQICGATQMENVLSSYNYFLEQLESPEIRSKLKSLDPSNRDDLVFRDLKNEGHRFTRELMKLFESTFDSTHPVRRAVIF